MPNPILVEVTRGQVVESFHRGAVAVVDAVGHRRLQVGDVETPVFPRSAVKAIQALPLIESGAAAEMEFGDREIALACASHSGEQAHVSRVQAMLDAAWLSEADLECGGHWSFVPKVAGEQARQFASTPTAIWNNCSGKHAGFLATAKHLGWPTAGYVKADHPVQREVSAALESLTGGAYEEGICGRDGCSIPTYAISLNSIAQGFAKLATGVGLSPNRAAAGRRILEACVRQPFFTAGTGRFCTRVIELADERIYVKTGAEGVYAAVVPELGFGIALKCDDGATRAAEVMLANVLTKIMPPDDPLQGPLKSLTNVPVETWNGTIAGVLRPCW